MSFEKVRFAAEALIPNQGGALVIGLLVTWYALGDHRRLISRRNGILAVLLALAPLLLDLVDHWERFPGSRGARILFTGIYAYTAFVVGWAIVLAFLRARPMAPGPGRSALLALVGLSVTLNVVAVFGRPPDDCGHYTNLGARRWVETGTIPYKDERLRGPDAPGHGAAATYGPVLYAAHVPAQALLRVPSNAADADPRSETYRLPPAAATQIVCLAFQLGSLLALYLIGRRFGDGPLGLALVAAFAASPYVLGMGGERLVIGGMPFISHLAPTALVLWAFLATRRPIVCGSLLALASGALFVPAFFFPTWWGWFAGRGQGIRFALGFLLTGLVLAGVVHWGTHGSTVTESMSAFLTATLEHQEGTAPDQYGESAFGFWGTHPEWAAFWQRPVFGGGSLFKPTFLAFAALCLAGAGLARGRNARQLAALTAALAAAVQLWKTHAAGTYVEWYYPFLLIALFCPDPRESPLEARAA